MKLVPSSAARAGPRGPAAEVADTGHGYDGQQETNMSLDNTSHPGRPGSDELVPSR